jgi:hypothetical protein
MSSIRLSRLALALCLIAAAAVSPASADQAPPAAFDSPAVIETRVDLPVAYEGPAPPELPATSARDTEGRTTVRAVRLSAPLRLDGQLDEAIYTTVTPISDFIQTEPVAAEPATERTEVWISFDTDNVYVSVRAFESQPDRMIVNEMRRDSWNLTQNENFGFALDTFYDRRNSVNFSFNPIGGRQDGQNTNEGNWNGDWNPIWDLAVRRGPDGWTAEAAVPFKSLRFQPGAAQIWGVQLRRVNRWKNEVSFLTRVPDGSGNNGLSRTSQFATLVGVEAPLGSRMFDVKPYVTADLTRNAPSPGGSDTFGKNLGFDVKYGVTRGLTGDVTYNTDFAQVEADEQQVNLTRFSLFFPEKRDFFLENQGIFYFGGAGNFGGDTPTLFYSRRIGLDQGQVIPIEAGGRLTGRAGAYSIGLLNIQTDDVNAAGVPSTNFSLARVRRDILRRSAIGVMATRRSQISGGTGAGETFGVDATFAFFTHLSMQTYWAKTSTPGLDGHDTSYRAQFNYNGDRYGLSGQRLAVGRNFNPEMGYVRRPDFAKYQVNARFSPRPTRIPSVRKFQYQVGAQAFRNDDGHLESQELNGEFKIEFASSDEVQLNYQSNFERLFVPFAITDDVTVASGDYDNTTLRGEFTIGQQRTASGTLFFEQGAFYGGDRTVFGYSSGRVKINSHLALEPGLSINRVTLPVGSFTARLMTSRVTYTITPLMFVSSLVQYNSSNNAVSTNARLRWEYRPGSELFIVYNEGRDTQTRGLPDLQNRSLIVKVNRLLRF